MVGRKKDNELNCIYKWNHLLYCYKRRFVWRRKKASFWV